VSALFPNASGWVLVTLYVTIALMLVVELGMLMFLLKRKKSKVEMVWTAIPGFVVVLILFLTRQAQ
jgi:hypothetical protein